MWRDYLAKATENLAAARRDFDHGSYDPCASRTYFSSFQVALAVLIALTAYQKRGRHWEHGDIAAQFSHRLIRRRKIFPRSMTDALDELRQRRHRADYSDVLTSRKRARQCLVRAQKFNDQIKEVLQREEWSR